MSSFSRNNQIDLLRGVAILLVLILHFNISYHLDQSALSRVFSTSFIQAVASNGNYGVTIFFVISGFLITTTSLERYGTLGNIELIGFYIFRFARIMPCLLLVLSLIALFGMLHLKIFQNDPNSTSLTLAIFSVLTFWHNILMEKIGYFNYCLNIFWSLSVEEIFYLTFPLLCFLLNKTRNIILFLLTLIVIAPIYRGYHADNEIIALYGNFSCFDAIAIGCTAAIIASQVQLTARVAKMLYYTASIGLVSVYLYSGIMANVVSGVSLMAVAAAIYLISASSGFFASNNSAGLMRRVICWFGKNSYELYLFHIVVLAMMKEVVSPADLGNYTKLLWTSLFFLVTAIVAGSISLFYSEPMNKKLRSLFFGYKQTADVSLTFSEGRENS